MHLVGHHPQILRRLGQILRFAKNPVAEPHNGIGGENATRTSTRGFETSPNLQAGVLLDNRARLFRVICSLGLDCHLFGIGLDHTELHTEFFEDFRPTRAAARQNQHWSNSFISCARSAMVAVSVRRIREPSE